MSPTSVWPSKPVFCAPYTERALWGLEVRPRGRRGGRRGAGPPGASRTPGSVSRPPARARDPSSWRRPGLRPLLPDSRPLPAASVAAKTPEPALPAGLGRVGGHSDDGRWRGGGQSAASSVFAAAGGVPGARRSPRPGRRRRPPPGPPGSRAPHAEVPPSNLVTGDMRQLSTWDC